MIRKKDEKAGTRTRGTLRAGILGTYRPGNHGEDLERAGNGRGRASRFFNLCILSSRNARVFPGAYKRSTRTRTCIRPAGTNGSSAMWVSSFTRPALSAYLAVKVLYTFRQLLQIDLKKECCYRVRDASWTEARERAFEARTRNGSYYRARTRDDRGGENEARSVSSRCEGSAIFVREIDPSRDLTLRGVWSESRGASNGVPVLREGKEKRNIARSFRGRSCVRARDSFETLLFFL